MGLCSWNRFWWLVLLVLPGRAWGQSAAVTQMLSYQPLQKGVVISTPSGKELAACKVETAAGPKAGSAIWILKDGEGRLLRRFADTNADKYPDVLSYYKDGREVYREVDSTFRGKADRYLWLGEGGMKIGLDRAGKGTIDAWEAISIEELSQEVLKAIAKKNFAGIQALLITEEELRGLGLPVGEIERIRKLQANAASHFEKTCGKLGHFAETTKWLHTETGIPARILAESTGGKQDIIMYYRGMILCETAGKTDYVQLGEIVQVGQAWKLLDAPLPADAMPPAGGIAGGPAIGPPSPAGPTQELLRELAEVDSQAPKTAVAGPDKEHFAYHTRRLAIIEKLVDKVGEEDRLLWQKQLVDSMVAAINHAQPNDTLPLKNLNAYAHQIAKAHPGSDIASYATFRALSIDFAMKTGPDAKPQDIQEAQKQQVDRLVQFVAAYPRCETAPDALHQIGLFQEVLGKEDEARKAYQQLIRDYPNARQAAKAVGSLRRFDLIGKQWELVGKVTALQGPVVSPAQLQGRTVIVYYWATWCQSAASDFAKLQEVLKEHASKNLTLVAVCVDESEAEAREFVQKAKPPGYQLYVGGGLESPATVHYGMVVFPSIFLVDASGRVVQRNLDPALLDELLKKPGK